MIIFPDYYKSLKNSWQAYISNDNMLKSVLLETNLDKAQQAIKEYLDR